jgi:hypothetical protein
MQKWQKLRELRLEACSLKEIKGKRSLFDKFGTSEIWIHGEPNYCLELVREWPRQLSKQWRTSALCSLHGVRRERCECSSFQKWSYTSVTQIERKKWNDGPHCYSFSVFRGFRVRVSQITRGFQQSSALLRKYQDSNLKQATMASIHIISNLSASYHPTIRLYITDAVQKRKKWTCPWA